MIVRRETPGDAEAVRSLFTIVYSDDFYERLYEDPILLQALSFVALDGNDGVAGHVAAARGRVGDTPALALVPPSVHPHRRGAGIGHALMHTILGGADALGESIAGVVAPSPEYLHRFGFRPGEEYGIMSPVGEWQPFFLVRPLTVYDETIRGTFTFPDAFL